MGEYKLHSGATVKTDRAPTPVKDWQNEGRRLFGNDVRKWRFVCPMCGKEYSVGEFMEAGGDGPNSAYQECIGRYLHAGPPDKEKGNPNGCNWCAYGLFGTAGKGRLIEADDGTIVEAFHFAGKGGNQ